MPINDFYYDNTDGVLTLRCRALDAIGFEKHCFTTRLGGVSRGSLESLNLAFSREDRATVTENYRRVFKAVGFTAKTAVHTKQEHTDIVTVVDGGYNIGGFNTLSIPSDGLVTDIEGVCLTVFTADCTPVILADGKNRVVACVHSGWRGTAMGIAKVAVEIMHSRYGCDTSDITAAIGPCIGACCYEVGREVYDSFDEKQAFTDCNNGKYMLDMGRAIESTLISSGVKSISIANECTRCKGDIYYSHRRSGNSRGSMAAMIEI